jgi:acetyl-CoA acyltransferase
MNGQIREVYIVSAKRTAVAKKGGAMRFVRPDDMLAHVLRGVLDDVPAFDESGIGDVVVGCAMPEGEQGMNVARIGLLLAGLPDSVPGVTVNRFCASGLNAVADAAMKIMTGQCDIAIGAGTESMTAMPTMMGNKVSVNPRAFESPDHIAIAYGMGLTAEKVAQRYAVSREDQDAFALASHEKALAAMAAGCFRDEVLPYAVRSHLPDLATNTVRISERVFDTDEGPRPDSSLEGLAKLRTVFAARGSVTAGNSSQMSDGAAAVLLMSEEAVKRTGATPIARFRSFAVAGVPPEIMGIGPVEAIPRALGLAGMAQDDIDWIELNEAFAAQALAVMRTLHLDPAKVNPLGGAIALGHPLGATGAIRTATVIAAMQRGEARTGMVTMCIGTGMGAAGIFEKV